MAYRTTNYVVYLDYGMEGKSEPLGLFSSKEKAALFIYDNPDGTIPCSINAKIKDMVLDGGKE